MPLEDDLSAREAYNLTRWLGLCGLTAEDARSRDKFLAWHNGIFDAGVTEGRQSLLPPNPEEGVENLRVSNRTYNALKKHGVTTVGELLRHSAHDLRDISNIGKHNLEELTNRLKELGLDLAEENIHDERKHSKQWGEPGCPIKEAALERRRQEERRRY